MRQQRRRQHADRAVVVFGDGGVHRYPDAERGEDAHVHGDRERADHRPPSRVAPRSGVARRDEPGDLERQPVSGRHRPSGRVPGTGDQRLYERHRRFLRPHLRCKRHDRRAADLYH